MIVAYTPRQWAALADWLRVKVGTETVMSDLYRGTPADRVPHAEQLDRWIEELTSRYGMQDMPKRHCGREFWSAGSLTCCAIRTSRRPVDG